MLTADEKRHAAEERKQTRALLDTLLARIEARRRLQGAHSATPEPMPEQAPQVNAGPPQHQQENP